MTFMASMIQTTLSALIVLPTSTKTGASGEGEE